MRKFIFILLFSVSVNFASAATYAVIVGVEQYDGTIDNLTAAVDDAERVYRFFLNYNNAENMVLLRDKEATKQKILYAMETLFAKAKADDMVVFYFSGHGAPGLFCPSNVKGGKMGLWHTEIKTIFKKCKAKTKLCIADACFAGSIKGRANNVSQTATHSTATGDNVIIFMSSRDSEVSFESRYERAGYFTSYVLSGMRGSADFNKDGIVNAYELYSYVRRQVREDSDGEQTPVMFGNFNKYVPLIKY